MPVLLKMLTSLFIFLKEIFLTNPTYQAIYKKNKHVIVVSIFCFLLLVTLLFNVEKTLNLVQSYKAMEAELRIVTHKYEIMANVYGENASEDPDIVKEVLLCRQIIADQTIAIETYKERLDYKRNTIEYLQRQIISHTTNQCL